MKNLNYVGSLVQLDLQDFTTHNLTRIMQYCIDCYKHVLRYKTDKAVKVAYLQLNDVNNAPFPKDYEYYTKVAMNFGNQLVTLSMNNDIPLLRNYDCGIEKREDFDPLIVTPETYTYTFGFLYAPHYRNGMYVGEMYSYGGGFNEFGYFRVDHQLKQFQFYNVPRKEVVLEYVADVDVCGDTLIYYSDVNTIRSYVHWKLTEYDKKTPIYDKERKLGLFNAALMERTEIEYIPAITDYLDATYKNYKSSPKR